MDIKKIQNLARLLRYYSLISTTEAGSGHPTSSLSAADLMATLCFGGFFRYDLENPLNPNNDRLIFSKGHASPLFYSIWAATGAITEKELLTLRKSESPLEGHPTMKFRFTEAATGSLGQGLSIGVGIAINAKYIDKTPCKTFVLLGDSEMAEGSIWEALQIASHYKLDNLIGILDVNRLGQRGETMYGYKVKEYEKRIKAFGWKTMVVDGHKIHEIIKTLKQAVKIKSAPVMIIAKTIKGKGVKFLENKDGWHGKALSADELKKALKGLGTIDTTIRGEIASSKAQIKVDRLKLTDLKSYNLNLITYNSPTATRKAYGEALVNIFPKYPNIVVLDAEVSNSTYAEIFQKAYPKRFFEMYIAEQNMVGVAIGLSHMGKIPFVSTFSAFFTRAHDQIRMAQYSDSNIKFVGSHCGVSIGEDGASQMGLEDIAMFRTILNSVVLYPSDAVSTVKLVEEAAKHKGIVYIRTTRGATPVIYGSISPSPRPSPQRVEGGQKLSSPGAGVNPSPWTGEGGRRPDEGVEFPIGGSKTLRSSDKDAITIVAAGITLHEALAAHNEMKKEGIYLRVIDLYSIKPLDHTTLEKAAKETKAIIAVEDHYAEGGLGEAVRSALGNAPSPQPSPARGEGVPSPWTGEGVRPGRTDEGGVKIISLAVRKMPMSGKPQELLNYEEISKDGIIDKVKEVLKLNIVTSSG